MKLRSRFLVEGTLMSMFTLTTLRADLSDNLDAFWTLDEVSGSFEDVSGNNHDLTPIGQPHGDGANGVIGGAIHMDGTSANTAVSSTAGKYAATDTFSASVWVKLDSLPSVNYFLGRIVGGTFANNDRAGWRIGSGNTGSEVDRIRFEFASNNGGNAQVAKFVEVGAFLTLGEWVHIVVVHNGTSDLSDTAIYVNGIERAIVRRSSGNGYANTVASNEVDLVVGGRLAQLGTVMPAFVDGDIDLVGLWSRALTADEINALYNDGYGLVPFESGSMILFGYLWPR